MFGSETSTIRAYASEASIVCAVAVLTSVNSAPSRWATSWTVRCRPPRANASCRGPAGADHHQCAGADGKQAMSRARIGELATDAAEVIYVDECDVVDERSVDVTDEVALK